MDKRQRKSKKKRPTLGDGPSWYVEVIVVVKSAYDGTGMVAHSASTPQVVYTYDYHRSK